MPQVFTDLSKWEPVYYHCMGYVKTHFNLKLEREDILLAVKLARGFLIYKLRKNKKLQFDLWFDGPPIYEYLSV